MASNAIIQSSSSTSSQIIRRYDVFVSFRGDTRNNFTRDLFAALNRQCIDCFIDDTKLGKGKPILAELMQAIEGSQILIVVFSKGYASSTWCLRELVKIASYIDIKGKYVLPIFYDVDPSEVRKQSGNYENAFAKYEREYKEDKEKMEEVQGWRKALTDMANLGGWDMCNKPQNAEIGEIVRKILKILGRNFSRLSNDDSVGIESRIKELEELLFLDSNDVVRVVGIYGMPGIGKTTLAKALYGIIFHRFDLHCFIDDVRKTFRDSGILGVQKQLLCQALSEENLALHNVSKGTHLVRTRLRHERVLIVLDNVDQINQLNELGLNRTCLGAGSRIIIISSNEQILRNYEVDGAFQVKPLNDNTAVQLFCRNAFKDNYIRYHYRKLTHDVLSYAQGHPLAIKVLGSFLFGRDVSHWVSALDRLRENPNKTIMDVFRMSYDELDDETEKQIFLDIACFFNQPSDDFVKEILEFRGFHPDIGLRVLVEKSLININEWGDITMHGLLVDLGRHIVKEKSPKEPKNWNRLWDVDDFFKVMADNMAATNLEAIVLDGYLRKRMRFDNLSEMSNLNLLILSHFEVDAFGNLNHLSSKLGYLIWDGYPFDCLPPSFQPNNLVELSLRHSRIKKLWERRKPLPNLRRLDLSFSHLIEMPDLGEAPNLEKLNLQGCKQLQKIHESIGFLTKLTVLNVRHCINLVSLPNNILGIHSLVYLSLSGCSKLYDMQSLDKRRDREYVMKPCIDKAPIRSQPASSVLLHSRTNCRENEDSVLLPSLPLSFFPRMRKLDLSFCNLIQIPDAVGNLCCLERLNLRGNNFATLPSLEELSKLFYLNLNRCTKLKWLSKLPSRTELPSLTDFWDIKVTTQGLFMCDCRDLVEREDWESMVLSWMMQLVEAVHQASIVDRKIESIIPGSEIPKWFNNQHLGMGNLLSIDAYPKHNNCIGVAFCVPFVVSQRERSEQILEISLPRINRKRKYLSINCPEDVATPESGHMWLFYIPSEDIFPRGVHEEFEIYIQIDIYDVRRSKIEVKNYGYRWIYEQDLEPCSFISTRKPKFLAIQENM